MLLQDIGLLREVANAKDIHQALIYDLRDELTYLSEKYGQDSFAYQKSKKRLERVNDLFKRYDRIFETYSHGYSNLETQNFILKKLVDNYQNP